ncbi:hypothetical protein [Microbacterium sp.]|uniref:hypothetical protein n=1 Tax=Microbacterium sp. TaxID=51671 RepID=UPI002898B353|nr:hypothetical protein [Microbacterium sp.]
MDSGQQAARRARALRGFAAAFVAVVVSATAHTLSGGGAPPAWLLVAVALLATPVAVALVGDRPRPLRLAAAVVLAQAALHLAFAAVGTADPVATGHVHGAPVLGTALAAPAHPFHASGGMMIGHAIAAVVTVVLLARGERMLAALGRGIRRLVPRLAAPSLAPRAPRVRALAPMPATRPALPPFSLSRRGPPALAR